MMKTNEVLQRDVQNALKWEPSLHAAEIGVTAKDGIVTLSGTVDSYTKKTEAEWAAKNVLGVKALVENIVVHFHDNWSKRDGEEIALEIVEAFKSKWGIPTKGIKVKVEDGWVTLEGELQWNYQREAAEKTATSQVGVKGLTNLIKIKSETNDSIEKKQIEEALARNWAIDSKNIHVEVGTNKVTLQGKVESVYEKEQAARIAWNAPGVWSVDNQLVVTYENALMN
jgi:osmotically-inducible protein OsmY